MPSNSMIIFGLLNILMVF